ncbi:hypothetical protein ACSBQY_05230 [Micrococcus lylae]|uniref:hypothetical protein n=1 Tax=Micrococcus lylae TaxID=1273 RepID=UPI003EBB1DA1
MAIGMPFSARVELVKEQLMNSRFSSREAKSWAMDKADAFGMCVATASRVPWSRTSRAQSITDTVSCLAEAIEIQLPVAAPSVTPGPSVSSASRGCGRRVPAAALDAAASATWEAAAAVGSRLSDGLGSEVSSVPEEGASFGPSWSATQPESTSASAAAPAPRGRRRRRAAVEALAMESSFEDSGRCREGTCTDLRYRRSLEAARVRRASVDTLSENPAAC